MSALPPFFFVKMPAPNNTRHAKVIDKRDFDAGRPLLLRDTEDEEEGGDLGRGRDRGEPRGDGRSHNGHAGHGDGDDYGDVACEISERDRKTWKRQVVKVVSLTWGVGSAYVRPFLFFLIFHHPSPGSIKWLAPWPSYIHKPIN